MYQSYLKFKISMSIRLISLKSQCAEVHISVNVSSKGVISDFTQFQFYSCPIPLHFCSIPVPFLRIPVPFLRIPEDSGAIPEDSWGLLRIPVDSWGFLQEWEGHCKVLLKGCIEPTGIAFPTIAWWSKSEFFCWCCRSLFLRRYICLFGEFLFWAFCWFLCNCFLRFLRNFKDNLFSRLFLSASAVIWSIQNGHLSKKHLISEWALCHRADCQDDVLST